MARSFTRKLLGSHSQYSEDIIIDALLAGKPSGFYVDIGANHPNSLNNTKHFYDKGWNGVNIEPNPSLYDLLVTHRPKDINLNIGIGPSGKRNFYVLDADTLSTFDEKIVELRAQHGYRLNKTIEISTKPLRMILQEYANERIIDFCSIDVEGYELEVIKSNDWERYRPTLLLVEINSNTESIYSILDEHDYRSVFSNGTNAIFIDIRPK